jgi:diaminopimelate decarboxylase
VHIGGPSDLAYLADELLATQRILEARWGAHFHQASSAVGIGRWTAERDRFLGVVERLAARLGPPSVIDFGGGWHKGDTSLFVEATSSAQESVHALFGGDCAILVEPGKLLVEAAGATVCSVLGTTVRAGQRAVVVDACLGEVPEVAHRWHPIARLLDDAWSMIQPGNDVLLGRSCMEADILASEVDLSGLRAGDQVAILDCGAYDSSMSYDFGNGIRLDV